MPYQTKRRKGSIPRHKRRMPVKPFQIIALVVLVYGIVAGLSYFHEAKAERTSIEDVAYQINKANTSAAGNIGVMNNFVKTANCYAKHIKSGDMLPVIGLTMEAEFIKYRMSKRKWMDSALFEPLTCETTNGKIRFQF